MLFLTVSGSYMQFIIRLFPEITIKSAPVRKRWSKKLVDNLRILARRIHEQSTVVLDWDRIVLNVASTDPEIEASMTEMLKCTPGIAYFSRVVAYPYSSIHDIYERTYEHWLNRLDGKTFCVRVKRTGNHDFTSIEVERYIGGGLNQNCATGGVKLKHPDETILVEIKNDTCYIVEARNSGLGGFPLGTQEDVLTLVSGGFDSTVATYMLMRRGLKTHFCFFNLGGKDHELGVKEVAFYLWNKFGSSHRVKFVNVPFDGVVSEILQNINPSNMGVVLKRMMLRAAERIADRGGFDALVTGEAISQVSSQTLPNLSAIDKVTDKLVLRPLIAMDKPEIISLARKIGTEELCASIPEYCGVISVKPSAKVNVEKLEKQEEEFDFDVLDRAIEASRYQLIDDVVADIEAGVEECLEVAELSADDVVVDVRHPHEQEIRPLHIDPNPVLTIPFYALASRADEFAADKQYLLYCDKGVMSKLHAAHLTDMGMLNIGIYRPGK